MSHQISARVILPRTAGIGPGVLALAIALVWPKPANALIVYQGKIVPAWPNIRGPALAASPSGERQNAPGDSFFPRPSGTVKGLTLLVDFSDQSGAFSAEEISDWLNLEGYSRFGCNGSVHDYYYDVSNGMVDLENTVVGYYRAKNPKSYYEAEGNYDRAGELLEEVLDAVDADVDFSEYDNDQDGTTEAISIVYAGPAVTWGQGLWPHSGWIGEQRDGVTLDRYQMTNMGETLGLYVFVHETGHMLFGWPDLYGFGDYGVMGNYSDDTNPVPVNDFFRADQGWIPWVDITSATNATYAALANGTGYRYVNPDRTDELFFWSNVQNTGRWDYLRGSGLLALHYDGSIEGNNPPDPLQLAVVQADGKKDLDATMWPSPGSDANDYFRDGYNSEWSSSTSPDTSWNDGSESGLRMYAVSATGPSMQFSVGDGSAGGSPSAGGTTGTGGDVGSGGSEAMGGSATTGGSSEAGGQTVGGAVSSGGSSSGGRAAGGELVSEGGNESLGGSTTVAGTYGAVGNASGGAAATLGGKAGVAGDTSAGSTGTEAVAVSRNDASGCSCKITPDYRRHAHRGLFVFGLLAGLLGWKRRGRRVKG